MSEPLVGLSGVRVWPNGKPDGKLGPGWSAGNPEQANQVLLSLKRLTQCAADAATDDTASWELLRTAVWWVDSMIRDLIDPALEEGHLADGARTLAAMLLGAKAVPDAEPSADIDAAIELARGELLEHLDYREPPEWMAPAFRLTADGPSAPAVRS